MNRLLLLLGLLFALNAPAQVPPLVLPGKLPASQMDIGPYTAYYQDRSGDTLPLSVIRTRAFRPFREKRNERASYSDVSVIVVWLRFTLRNTHPTDTLRCLHDPSSHGLVTYYRNGQRIGETGLALPPPRHQSPYMHSITVPPGGEYTYHVRVIDYLQSVVPIFSLLFTQQGSYDSFFVWDYAIRALLAVEALLIGCLVFMLLYSLYSYLQTRDSLFVFYALYALTCMLLLLHGMLFRHNFPPVFGRHLSPYLRPLNLGFVTFWYSLFIARVVELPAQFPRTWLVLKALLAVLLVQEAHSVVEWLYGRPLFYSNWAFQYAMVPANLTVCVLASAIVRSQSVVRNYLLAGVISLLVIAFVPGTLELWFKNLSGVNILGDVFLNYVPLWVKLGLVVEAFCFMLALSRRSFLIEREKNQMQERHARELEEKLAERTREIEQQSRQLEQQHIRQLELGFEQKLAETEMTALRAQMNPHFIFNCLNSIKLYATENDSTKAAEYLTKFSRLIRLVLENSRSERVTLQNELDALRLYLDMEAMRFKNKLRFEIEVEPGIDAEFTEIPPLLIQPYVENAIWHGLMHKPEGGTVSVRVEQPRPDHLRITVADDGVGRAKAAELKSKSATPKKSFGLKVTGERIALINQLYQSQTQVKMHDLVDAEGHPAGTEVVLEIPV